MPEAARPLRIAFAGTPEFAADHLSALIAAQHDICLVVTQPDKPGKRGKQPVASPVKEVATAAGLPTIQPVRLTAEDLKGAAPDVLVVVAFGQILRQPVLDLPRFGCINVHASLLPRWRGAAPIQRAILAGDEQTGVCIMQMDAGLDTGPVLARASTPVTPTDTTGSLTDRLSAQGQSLLLGVLEALAQAPLTSEPQEEDGVTYAHKIDKREALIDWQATARNIDCQVRAFLPEPVAHTTSGGIRARIWSATPETGQHDSTPGTVLSFDENGIRVACGEGTILRIERVQLAVGKGSVQTCRDLINGKRQEFMPGTVLGGEA